MQSMEAFEGVIRGHLIREIDEVVNTIAKRIENAVRNMPLSEDKKDEVREVLEKHLDLELVPQSCGIEMVPGPHGHVRANKPEER